MNKFRNLNSDEAEFINTLSKRKSAKNAIKFAESARISVTREGNTTVVAFLLENALYTGVAKRNPIDRNSPQIGKNVAIARAVRSKGVSLG